MIFFLIKIFSTFKSIIIAALKQSYILKIVFVVLLFFSLQCSHRSTEKNESSKVFPEKILKNKKNVDGTKVNNVSDKKSSVAPKPVLPILNKSETKKLKSKDLKPKVLKPKEPKALSKKTSNNGSLVSQKKNAVLSTATSGDKKFNPAMLDTISQAKQDPSILKNIENNVNSNNKENVVVPEKPIVPFRVGEQVSLDVSYFAMNAGKVILNILPNKTVDGEESYHFNIKIQTNRIFSMFYSVKDEVDTYMATKSLLPSAYTIKMKQSKITGKNVANFNHKAKRATTTERMKMKDDKDKNKDYNWKIDSQAQNVFTALFYVRAQDLTVGNVINIPIAHRGKNMKMKLKVLRKEVLKTKKGRINTIVVKPTEMKIKGAFKPLGDILIWLTDDDRKMMIRTELKIKIGKIVGALDEMYAPN